MNPIKKELFLAAMQSTLESDANLLSNPGFEIGGAGGADVFANWVEKAVVGTSTIERAVDSVNGGTYSCKLTRGDTAISVYQDVTVIPEKLYRLQFYTRGDGTNAGRYAVHDLFPQEIVGVTTTGVTGTSYSAVTKLFVTPAGCFSIRITLFGGSAGVVYFDDVSVSL